MAAGELDSLTPLLPKQTERRFPWSEPIIYRAGTYVVHAVGPSAEVLTKSKTAAEK
jgi:hypothetical protein